MAFSARVLFRLFLSTFFAYVFVLSGLIVSALSILLLVVWPLSKSAYRKITSGLAYTVLGRALLAKVRLIKTLIVSISLQR